MKPHNYMKPRHTLKAIKTTLHKDINTSPKYSLLYCWSSSQRTSFLLTRTKSLARSLVRNSLLPTNYCVTSYELPLRFASISRALRSVLLTSYLQYTFRLRSPFAPQYLRTTATLHTQLVALLSFSLALRCIMNCHVSLLMLSAVDESHFRAV